MEKVGDRSPDLSHDQLPDPVSQIMTVACPADQVLECIAHFEMVIQFGVKDFTYLIFCLTIQLYWWGRGLFSVGERVQEGRFKLGDMEHRVNPSELLQEADCDGVHPQGAYYLKGS